MDLVSGRTWAGFGIRLARFARLCFCLGRRKTEHMFYGRALEHMCCFENARGPTNRCSVSKGEISTDVRFPICKRPNEQMFCAHTRKSRNPWGFEGASVLADSQTRRRTKIGSFARRKRCNCNVENERFCAALRLQKGFVKLSPGDIHPGSVIRRESREMHVLTLPF